MQDSVETQDGEKLKLNIQHAIMIRQAGTNALLKKTILEARQKDLEVVEFTREMLQTSDDKKVKEMTGGKLYTEVEIL